MIDIFTFFPFLLWLAIISSAVLLVVLWASGDLGSGLGTVLLAWFAIAAYCQFFAASTGVRVAGLVLQTLLAIYLVLREKLSL